MRAMPSDRTMVVIAVRRHGRDGERHGQQQNSDHLRQGVRLLMDE
jgi:hypothetical protein